MRSFFNSTDVNLSVLATLCQQQAKADDYPNAVGVTDNIVIYDVGVFSGDREFDLKSELANCLKDGPGVFIVRGAYEDLSIIDRCTDLFARIVHQENQAGQTQGDHFGSNERIWNSLQKTCIKDPELFVEYYGNSVLRVASESWLGKGYRVTAQMNNIKPGGAAQSAHRDYHLGFQPAENIASFPLHAQVMSQFLTLQGAIVHTEMPVEAGPTLLLPFSQQYPLGYLASSHTEFSDYFAEHHVQLALGKGDMLFFNPALFHAGGRNDTSTDRIANLIQVSSPFGRTMETLNNRLMIEAVYPILLSLKGTSPTAEQVIQNAISVVADGYSFPTNLDSDPPINGNAPDNQQQLVRRSLAESQSLETLQQRLDRYDRRRDA